MLENASTSDAGIASVLTGLTNHRRAACHVRLVANVSRQKRTQRLTVFTLTCKRSLSLRRRAGVMPSRRTGTSNTVMPKNTFRPRNRSEGGVTRWRHPSLAQQKLKRTFMSGPRASGPPRGFRRKRAACNAPPHSHPVSRASAARSTSIFNSRSKNLGSSSTD